MQSSMYCDRCREFFGSQTDCPRCEDEPLLDLEQEGMLEMLIEQDERDKRAHKAKWISVAVPFAIPVVLLLWWLGVGLLFAGLTGAMFAAVLGQFLSDIFKFKPRPLPKP